MEFFLACSWLLPRQELLPGSCSYLSAQCFLSYSDGAGEGQHCFCLSAVYGETGPMGRHGHLEVSSSHSPIAVQLVLIFLSLQRQQNIGDFQDKPTCEDPTQVCGPMSSLRCPTLMYLSLYRMMCRDNNHEFSSPVPR